MQARDTADLDLISHAHFCPLGPLFLAASVKLGRTSPLELVDRARHRTATTSDEDLEELRAVTDCESTGGIKAAAFIALDSAEVLLRDLPDVMVGGLPANDDGVPVERAEDMACLRPVLDGGERFPNFMDAPPAFSDIGSQDEEP